MSTIRSTYKNEKGMALPLGLIFMAILALLGSIAVMTSTTDLQIVSNHKSSEQAFYAAEAGIQHGINWLRNNSTDFDNELNGATEEEKTVSLISPTSLSYGGEYTVRVKNNDDNGDLSTDSDGKILIVSTGTMHGASREIEVLFGIGSLEPDGAIAVYTPDDPTINIDGDPVIDGRDYILPPDPQCSGNCIESLTSDPGIAGFYTQQTSPTIDGADSPDLDLAPYSFVGNPDAEQYGGGNNTDWQAVARQLIPRADNTFTGNGTTFGNRELGNRTTPQITVVETTKSESDETRKFDGTVSGAGVLIIQGDGEVDFSGTLYWEGIIIVLSDSNGNIDLGISGDVSIFGAFVLSTTAPEEGAVNTVNLNFSENPEIVYSTEALTSADAVNTYMIPYAWKDRSVGQ